MPRRGENIIKRSDGRWEARVLLGHDKTGKSLYKSLYAHSYHEVKQKKNDFIRGGCAPGTAVKTVSQIADEWLSTVKLRCKPATYYKYESICRLHITPKIGKYRVDMMETADIAALLNSSENSPETRKLILSVLKMVIKYSGGGMGINFAALSPKSAPKEISVLTRNEQKLLSDYLVSNADLCRIGVYLCLCTGLRLGEICALRREDISFENNTLKVSGTLQRINSNTGETKTEIIIAKPKTNASERIIPLPQSLVDLIKPHYEALPEDFFVLSGKNSPVLPRTLQNRFKSYLNSVGIAETNFHTLRHTFATRCVENGMDTRTLSEILGHSNVGITLQRYVHPSLEAKRESMEKAALTRL